MNNQEALLRVINNGIVGEVQRLVDAGGVNLNPPPGHCDAHPLLLASYGGHVDIVHFLLNHGADVNQADEWRNTALIRAAYNNRADVVHLLLQRGALINARDRNGWTALHVAGLRGHVDVIRALLDTGADSTLKDITGNTAEDGARLQGKQAAMDILRNYVHVPPTNINTPSPAPQPSAVVPSPISGQADEPTSLRAQLQTTTDELVAARAQHVTLRQELEAANARLAEALQNTSTLEARTRAAETRVGEVETRLGTVTRERNNLAHAAIEAQVYSDAMNMTFKFISSFLNSLTAVIPPQDLVINRDGDALGRGSNGTVWPGRWQGRDVAIKTDMIVSLNDTNDVQKQTAAVVIIKECTVLQSLQSPHIVVFLGIVVDQAGLPRHVVMEKLRPLRGRLTSAEIMRLAAHVSAALRYMHGHVPVILHRDIKPANFLYPINNVYKVSDLGEARLLRSQAQTLGTRGIGTTNYQAPEMREVDAPQTSAVDIFSLGMALIELTLRRGSELGQGASETQRDEDRSARLAEVAAQEDHVIPSGVPEALEVPLSTWLARMTARDPAERPTDAECEVYFTARM